MRKLLFTAGLMVLLCPNGSAQTLQGKEVSGAIYLNDGRVIGGPLIYHEKEQVIVEKKSTGFEVYTTFHVDSFFFYDPELMWQRRFRKTKYRNRDYFFETVTPGRVSIVRLKLSQSAPDRMIKNEEDRHHLDYRYFVLYQDELSRLKDYGLKHLYAIHPEVKREMKKFARNRNLDFYKMSDKIQLIRKLNQLIKDQDTFSLQQ